MSKKIDEILLQFSEEAEKHEEEKKEKDKKRKEEKEKEFSERFGKCFSEHTKAYDDRLKGLEEGYGKITEFMENFGKKKE